MTYVLYYKALHVASYKVVEIICKRFQSTYHSRQFDFTSLFKFYFPMIQKKKIMKIPRSGDAIEKIELYTCQMILRKSSLIKYQYNTSFYKLVSQLISDMYRSRNRVCTFQQNSESIVNNRTEIF